MTLLPVASQLAPPKPAWRRYLPLALKLALAAALLTWLSRSGRFSLAAAAQLVSDPVVAISNLVAWVGAGIMVSSLRFRTMLKAIDVDLPLRRGIPLQMIALFFNSVVPGNVGGDVYKAVQIGRSLPEEKRASVYLLVFLERIFGLMGLASIALVVIALRAQYLFHSAILRPVATTGGLISLGIVVAPIVASIVVMRARSWVVRLSIGRKLHDGLALMLKKPRLIAIALGLSMLNQGLPMLFFFLATRHLVAPQVDFGTIATIFPLGILSLVVPISPGGLGVGHVAFDRLFTAVGLTGGATVFNVFILGQTIPCLVGLIPYLLMRGETLLPLQHQGLPSKGAAKDRPLTDVEHDRIVD